MAFKLPSLLISVSKLKFSKWYKLNIKTTGTLFRPLLKTELVHLALRTLIPAEDAQSQRTCYGGAKGSEGVHGPCERGPERHRTQVQMTTNSSLCKNWNPTWQTRFFNLLVCKGQAVSGCFPTCSFPVTLICLCCPGACGDGVNVVRSSRVASSPHGAGTAILSLLLRACVVRRLPSSLPWWDPKVRCLHTCLYLMAIQSLQVLPTVRPYHVAWSSHSYFNFFFATLMLLIVTFLIFFYKKL